MMDNKKVGASIALLRNNKHMTQTELGERVGVSFQAVRKWERGETLPDVSILPTLADALETTIDYILRSGEPTPVFRGKVFVAEAVIQSLISGMYVDVTDVMHSFKHERCRNIVLDYMKRYALV